MDRQEAALRKDYEQYIFSLLERATAQKSARGIATSWMTMQSSRRDDDTIPN
jgi:hypothetical protein